MAEPFQITTRELLFWGPIINAAIGFVLGLIPLLFGYFSKQLRLGVIGILTTTVGGAILGVLISIPATIVFTWLVARKAKAGSQETPDPAETKDV